MNAEIGRISAESQAEIPLAALVSLNSRLSTVASRRLGVITVTPTLESASRSAKISGRRTWGKFRMEDMRRKYTAAGSTFEFVQLASYLCPVVGIVRRILFLNDGLPGFG